MDPSVWGFHLWRFLHCTAAVSVTAQQRRDFVELIEKLALTLPCDKCKQHFRQNLRIHNIQNYLKNEETLFMYTYLLHDAVNEAQGKTGAQRPSFDEVYKFYFNVVDDSNAVGPDGYQNKICKEVCAATCGKDGSDNTSSDTTTKNGLNSGLSSTDYRGAVDGAFPGEEGYIKPKSNSKNLQNKIYKSKR